jgi:hypothetical protein
VATYIAYVVLTGVLTQEEAGAGLSEVPTTGVWAEASYATISPSNKSGVMGTVRAPFNYNDDDDAIFAAVETLVADAVKKETGTAPRVRFIGRQT